MSVATKERGILFSTPMVQAILAGKKSQTRRVVTVNNSFRQASPNSYPFDLSRAWRDPGFPHLHDGRPCEYLHVPFCHPEEGWEQVPGDDTVERWYSHHQPGGRLWVRETWAEVEDEWGCPIVAYKAGGSRVIGAEGERHDGTWRQFIIEDSISGDYEVDVWRPSIHMPRWASRITLEITGVRVERLQHINDEDCYAEGCVTRNPDEPQLDFEELWDSINGKKYPWSSNPWVWAIEFRRIQP